MTPRELSILGEASARDHQHGLALESTMSLSFNLEPLLWAAGALAYLLCALVAWRLAPDRWPVRLGAAAAGPFTLLMYGLAALCWTA